VECRLADIVESGLNEIFIGEIIATYTEERFLTDGKIDFRKMRPLILSQPDTSYWCLGESVDNSGNTLLILLFGPSFFASGDGSMHCLP